MSLASEAPWSSSLGDWAVIDAGTLMVNGCWWYLGAAEESVGILRKPSVEATRIRYMVASREAPLELEMILIIRAVLVVHRTYSCKGGTLFESSGNCKDQREID
jgi:hypothetical protein